MGNKDTKKIARVATTSHEWFSDIMPSKTVRNFKRKERQDGRKEIEKELKSYGKSQKKEK